MIFRLILLRMRNVSDQSCRENQNTHSMLSKLFSRKSCRLWDNVEKYGRAGLATDGNMAHALSRSLTKATDTHAEYVILISFPRQQWLRERVSVLRLYVRSLSCCSCLHLKLTLIPLHFVTFRRIVMPYSSGSSNVLTFRRNVISSGSGYWRVHILSGLYLRRHAKPWR
jgi:hypothetical protein